MERKTRTRQLTTMALLCAATSFASAQQAGTADCEASAAARDLCTNATEAAPGVEAVEEAPKRRGFGGFLSKLGSAVVEGVAEGIRESATGQPTTAAASAPASTTTQGASSTTNDATLLSLQQQLSYVEQMKAQYAGTSGNAALFMQFSQKEAELRAAITTRQMQLAAGGTTSAGTTGTSANDPRAAQIQMQLDQIAQMKALYGSQPGMEAYLRPIELQETQLRAQLAQYQSAPAAGTKAAASLEDENARLRAELAALQSAQDTTAAANDAAATSTSDEITAARTRSALAGDTEARTRAALAQPTQTPSSSGGLFAALGALGGGSQTTPAGGDAAEQQAALAAQQAQLQALKQQQQQQQLQQQQAAAAAQAQQSGGLGGLLGGMTSGGGGGFLGGVVGALAGGGDGRDTDSAAAYEAARQANAPQASMGFAAGSSGAASASMGLTAGNQDLAMLQSRDSMTLRGGSPVPPSDLPDLPPSESPYSIPAGGNFVNNVDMKVEAVRAYARAATAMLQSQIALSRAFGLSEQADALMVQAQVMRGGDLKREDVQSFVAVSSETNTLINARIAEGTAIQEGEQAQFGAGLAYYGVGLVRTREFAQELTPYFSDLQDTLEGVMNTAPGAMSTSNTLSLLARGAALINPENRRTLSTLVYVAMSAPNLLSSHGQTFRNLTSYANSNKIDVPDQQEALDTLGDLDFEMEVAAEG